MSVPTAEKLFPDDYFDPEIFSLSERRYIADHIGDKPSVMMDDPPPEGCVISVLSVALQRLFDDDGVDAEAIRNSVDASIKLYERRQVARQMTGSIPWGQLGVGHGRGQTRTLQKNRVRLSPMRTIRDNFFDDLVDPEEVVDPEALKLEFRVECGWCNDHSYEGTRWNVSVGNHVREKHPDSIKAWNELVPQIKKLRTAGEQRAIVASDEGITFRERE